jgi:hypothetical protein
MIKEDLSACSWKALSAQDKRDRLLAIEVLRRLRNGEKFAEIIKIGVTIELVQRHASPYVTEDDLNG